MNLESRRELEVTREKLRGLERVYADTLAGPGEKNYAQELTLRSLKRTINQLKEEIARFEAHSSSTAPAA
jgi:hypothetical protein